MVCNNNFTHPLILLFFYHALTQFIPFPLISIFFQMVYCQKNWFSFNCRKDDREEKNNSKNDSVSIPKRREKERQLITNKENDLVQRRRQKEKN